MFIVNVEVAINQNGRWLIIQRGFKEEHAGGTLSLVGGKVEKEGNVQDILEKTIKREVEEEVGITIKDQMHYVHSTSFIADDCVHVVDIVFLCEVEKGEAYRKSPDEVENIFWMTTEEILNDSLAPIWLKESIRRAEKLILTL